MVEAAQKYWRPEDVMELPYGRERYECIHGELLVTPSPRDVHQIVVGELFVLLHTYIKGQPGLQLRLSPADIELEKDTLVQPDLFICHAHKRELREQNWKFVKHMALVIEVLSPGSARFDRGKKRDLYMRTAVDEYWIVDVDARLVERWVSGRALPEIERTRLAWRAPNADTSIEFDLPAFFEDAIDGA